MLKGGGDHNMFWGSFNIGACIFSHPEGGTQFPPFKRGGGFTLSRGRKMFRTHTLSTL